MSDNRPAVLPLLEDDRQRFVWALNGGSYTTRVVLHIMEISAIDLLLDYESTDWIISNIDDPKKRLELLEILDMLLDHDFDLIAETGTPGRVHRLIDEAIERCLA